MTQPKYEYSIAELLMWPIKIDRIGVKVDLSCITFLHYSSKFLIHRAPLAFSCGNHVMEFDEFI
jgi:hypothetical protein